MNVRDALRMRKSIRAFKSDPVPEEVVRGILEIAQRSPSGTNTQPWHTYVCTGDVRDAISKEVLELDRRGAGKTYHELEYYPERYNDTHKGRTRALGWALYGLLGIDKGDREKSAKQAARNYLFFDAPVGIFVTIDRYLGYGSWLDTGMYVQSIMLAAKDAGLDTCPQASWLQYPEPIHRHLNIPDDQVLVTGMSLGFAAPDAIVNTLESEREAVDDVARFAGF